MSLTLLSGETLHVQAQHSDWQLEPSSRNAYFSQGRARQGRLGDRQTQSGSPSRQRSQ